jgi:hypothetical protein
MVLFQPAKSLSGMDDLSSLVFMDDIILAIKPTKLMASKHSNTGHPPPAKTRPGITTANRRLHQKLRSHSRST